MLLASMRLAEESIMAAIEVAGEPMGFTRLEWRAWSRQSFVQVLNSASPVVLR